MLLIRSPIPTLPHCPGYIGINNNSHNPNHDNNHNLTHNTAISKRLTPRSHDRTQFLTSTPIPTSIPTRLSVQSPTFLSSLSTSRKRRYPSLLDRLDVRIPVNHLNSFQPAPTYTPHKKYRRCNPPSETNQDKGVNNLFEDCVKGIEVGETPLIKNKTMDFEMDTDMNLNLNMNMDTDMEGITIPSSKPIEVYPKSASIPRSNSRPKLGKLSISSSSSSLSSIQYGSDNDSNLTIKSYPSSSSLNDMSSSPSKSILPPVMHLKRNPKKLSLSLPSSSSSSLSSSSQPIIPSPDCTTPSTVCPTPTAESDSKFGTPYTPGPPKTPALAMSLGRSTFRGNRRPSLLSLITNPPGSGNDDAPPTPSGSGLGGSHPYANMRLKNKGRAKSYTAADTLNGFTQESRSAFGNGTFPTIDESHRDRDRDHSDGGLSALGYALPTTNSPDSHHGGGSPTNSTSTLSESLSASTSRSTSSTPSTSPPLPTSFTFNVPLSYAPKRQIEPYEDGPIEILPGIYLGTEDSVHHFDKYTSNTSTSATSSKVRIINVAQEIDDPFDESSMAIHGWSTSNKGKNKEKMKFKTYPKDPNYDNYDGGRPEIEYCHIRWSHGELGLADIPDTADLMDVLNPTTITKDEISKEQVIMWRFWEIIQWMEKGRKEGIPILIHCQCGVSRSATLAIAYTMTLAATGAMPEILGHIRSMQDAYDFVKSKSSWIGPNHSLVFQLVDFARHLTHLLSLHQSSPDAIPIRTSFPKNQDAELSEAEWARRRREFEESENGSITSSSNNGSGGGEECVSPEEADLEARRLDEEMLLRKARR
ncbi:uncharacterized protein IL334_002118 [Kwoniella shivajii]|uniref:protein-tyrosine-phosphatase n=1 Tax=Kwoniella shivajii TaxID=564305 RepID=A0ABZ1CU59_9TREE|nr:hypothetical protein IL334_002118 [Kwoniella shivajii]